MIDLQLTGNRGTAIRRHHNYRSII